MLPAKLRLLMITENANDGMPRQVRLTSSIGRKELASHTEGAISESLVLRQLMPSKSACREHGASR